MEAISKPVVLVTHEHALCSTVRVSHAHYGCRRDVLTLPLCSLSDQTDAGSPRAACAPRRGPLSVAAFALSGLLALTAGAAGREFFVAPEGDDVNNDGLSWAQPFKTIQHAVDQQEQYEYLTVTISNGTYRLAKTIAISPSVSGGVRLRSFSGNPADTIIDGGGACACVRSTYNQQRNCFLGLTFQNGVSTNLVSNEAGGIYTEQRCFVSNCVVRNCSRVLTNGTHTVAIYGGGLSLSNQADVHRTVDGWNLPPAIVDTLVENCAVVSKTTASKSIYGGGVSVANMQLYGVTIRGCAVTNETPELTSFGAGGLRAYSSIVSNCTIVGNSLVLPSNTSGIRGLGAGVHMGTFAADQTCLLVDSVVAGNVTSGGGAGVSAGPRSHILRVAITNNVALTDAGAYADGTKGGGALAISGEPSQVSTWTVVEDCLIEGNDSRGARSHAGGVSIWECNCVRLAGTVIRNNRAALRSGINITDCSNVIVTNCVIAGNATTNQLPGICIRNNIYKTDGGTDVSAVGSRRCQPIQFTDCFVVANTNSHPSGLTHGAGFFGCTIGDATKAGRVAYVTPVIVRNCLFANNWNNVCSGWCLRFHVCDPGYLAYFDDWKVTPIRVDHCTFAGNRNSGGYEAGVLFYGSTAAASNTAFRGCVFSDNLYWCNSSSPKNAVFSNGYPPTLPEIANTYGDAEDDCLKATAENGNIIGGETRFVDAAHGNYALKPGSCLIDRGGAFADWMGDGRRKSASRDLTGGYVIASIGPYGVTVTRPDSNPRRSGAASDIGCCEYQQPRGLVFLIR